MLPTPPVGTRVTVLEDSEHERRGATGTILKVVVYHRDPGPEDLFVIDYDDGPIVELRRNVRILADQ